MKREQRLRKGAEFDTVYRKGTVIGGPFLVLRVLPNDLGYTRWGFAVGKKIAKRATQRNFNRRRLKAAADQANATVPADIIVTARKEALDATYDELRHALERGLRRAQNLVAAE